ncbi:hypothetical protein [Mycoplasmopsis agalactiae]|uniref:hypothetical protein n=1 Tax=Mycoplasmopsis agalactiae TaxID=2110 RepID=UPI001F44EE98|nr:hypothetical protein [Mycoplasmopsis agalactiae]
MIFNWFYTAQTHFSNGLYLKNELGTINKNKDTYFSYSVNDNNFDNNGNLNIPQAIKAADFIENHLMILQTF